MFTDIHSHILPAVDDGAKDFSEAEKLLLSEKENGVESVVLTPHFYAGIQPLSRFTEHIRPAFCDFKNKLSGKDLPKVFLGCELHWFRGVADSSELQNFMISGTDYLLLELPFMTEIDPAAINDILRLYDNGVNVIIAHTERYFRSRLYKDILAMISDGVCFGQINAGSLLDSVYKKAALKLFDKGLVSFVASDAHSVESRPVRIKDALALLKKRNPEKYAAMLSETENLKNSLKD